MMILDSGYIFGPPCIVAPISAFNFASDSAYTHTHTHTALYKRVASCKTYEYSINKSHRMYLVLEYKWDEICSGLLDPFSCANIK